MELENAKVAVDSQDAVIESCIPNADGEIEVQTLTSGKIVEEAQHTGTPRPKRVRKRPTFLADDYEFMHGPAGKYSSGKKHAKPRGKKKKKKGSVVKDFMKYDPKRGIFLRLVGAKELEQLATKKRKQAPLFYPQRERTSHAEKPKDTGARNKLAGVGKKNGSKRYESVLWDLHQIDKANAISSIGCLLPPLLRKRAINIGDFFLFCHERQCMWVKRQKGISRPWTKDPILESKHFTNLYRELDAGTVFFRRSMIKQKPIIKEATVSQEQFELYFAIEILWASICYRAVCRVETFNELGGIPTLAQWDKFSRDLKRYHSKGNVIFTAAYQNMGYDRFVQTMKYLKADDSSAVKSLANKIIIAGKKGDLQRCTNDIQQLPNIGPFFAWQITCDLMECGVLKGCDEDTSDYVKLGPGAKGGLKVIFGESRGGPKDIDLCLLLREKQDRFFNSLGVQFERFNNRALSLKVLEHALCEFYKYNTCLSTKTLKSARMYRGLNGYAAKMNSKECASFYCEADISRRCDTCWQNFCTKCSSDNGAISWICNDCEDLKL